MELLQFPGLLLAMLVMACLAVIPRRMWHAQLLAVSGWVLVCLDNTLSKHWLDYLGLAIFGAGLALPLLNRRRPAGRANVPAS